MTKINEKEAENGPFLKKHNILQDTLKPFNVYLYLWFFGCQFETV